MINVTVVVGGHPFIEDQFAELFESLDGMQSTIVAWPDAERLFAPGGLDGTDVLVLYDMPGVGLRKGQAPQPPDPPAAVVDGWHRLLERGTPVVAMHHAIASWPAWPEFADVVGGRFLYAPARLHDTDWPDSGYAHDVPQRLTVLAPEHPVCAGLPDSFELTDETYLCPVFPEGLTPLIGTDAALDTEHHWSSALAVAGRMHDREGWSHPAGVPLAAWTHQVRNSTIVYVQPGDGPAAYGNPHYRRLLGNAINWVASTSHRQESVA